jgi:hypothetical protein
VFLNHQNLKEDHDEGYSSTFEPAPFLKHLLLKSFGKLKGKSAALIKYAPINTFIPSLVASRTHLSTLRVSNTSPVSFSKKLHMLSMGTSRYRFDSGT